MNNKILILPFLFIIFLAQGQEIKKLDKKYYLLGTLGDYMGRSYPKNNPAYWNYIIKLHQSEIGKLKRIEEVSNKKFKANRGKRGCSNCHEFYTLKSFSYARKINSFYKFEREKWKDIMRFNFYTGKLKCDKIIKAGKRKQLSFIAGLFLSAGEKENENYKISLYNSHYRYECAITLLKQLDSKIISSEIVAGIPASYFIVFEPSTELKQILCFIVIKIKNKNIMLLNYKKTYKTTIKALQYNERFCESSGQILRHGNPLPSQSRKIVSGKRRTVQWDNETENETLIE